MLRPDPLDYRYALYCRADRADLASRPTHPVALYRDESLANAHGTQMWPTAFTVIDLHGEDSPCGNRS